MKIKKNPVRKISLTSILFLMLLSINLKSQKSNQLPFLQPADTLHKARFWTSVGIGTAVYSGVSIGLWETWYKGFELSSFHLFNDWGEWNQLDKAGHWFSTYNECVWAFQGARWTGMKRRKALWTAVGIGSGIQATIEIMDGFSKKWGFSVGDIAFNTLGAAAFASQEMLWQEQRITFKASTDWTPYATTSILSMDGNGVSSLRRRGHDLYGSNFAEVYLKDYNKLTIWASANIHAFAKNKLPKRFPKWLNVAVGYGSANLYGGFANEWQEGEHQFILDAEQYPRYRQFYLSLDVDFRRIKTQNRFLKTFFSVVNFVKIPAPALEMNSLGKIKFHSLYW